jgi:hypothetical protein
MKLSQLSLLFGLSFIFAGTAQSQMREPGLLKTDNVVAISQSDFTDGPYRITQPGYYYFTEDVSFNPTSPSAGSNGIDGGRTSDRPQTGAWFAALSIECDNVVIDLNTKTFDCTDDFIANHEFKVFSMIELNNSPFQHLVFAYKGETALKAAHNVVIKNGTLGKNSHHCIHGNLNSNVQIYDLVCKDWEVAGISLNGLKGATIKNVQITGVEHQVAFTGLLADIDSALGQLDKLITGGDTAAQAYRDKLQTFKDNVDASSVPAGTHDGNAYGLFINRTVDVGPIATHCGDLTSNCVTIENVTVCNVKAGIIETVAVGDNDGNRLKGIPFGVMRWVDAYAGAGGTFAPNDFIKAQAYVVNANTPSALPAGFAANILSATPSESTFTGHAKPIFNGDFAGHTNKGVFGIRVDCGHGVTIKNCTVMGIENVGLQGATLATLDGGSHYSFTESVYTGNDAYGISLAACHNCKIIDTCVSECSSINGNVRGISLMNESDANLVSGCVSSDHYAQLDNYGSVVNPSSDVIGFYVNNSANSNKLINCVSQSLECPRFAHGFLVQSSKDTQIVDCLSSGHRVTSSSNLDQAKDVVGFASLASECTAFEACTSRDMRCTGEDSETTLSSSRAAGFLLGTYNATDDSYASVSKCHAECGNGGSGTAVGILLDSADEASVLENKVSNNHAQTASGKGYGIQDTATATSSLFLKNIAYGNSTQNYSITFADPEALPLTACLYGKLANLYLSNSWNNLSIEHAPGTHYTGDNTNARTVIRQVVTG